MAAHIDYDTDKRIIYVTTAPTGGVLTLNAQVDIYSDAKEDWKTNSSLHKLKFPFQEPVGGNAIIPSVKSISPYYFLKYGWRMRPYEADHTLYLTDAYLLIDGGGDPWIKTLGAYTVNVRDSIPADAFTLDVGSILAGTLKMIGNKVTRVGDVITIYEDDQVTVWKQFDLTGGGRVEV